jgi:hypothetical protein
MRNETLHILVFDIWPGAASNPESAFLQKSSYSQDYEKVVNGPDYNISVKHCFQANSRFHLQISEFFDSISSRIAKGEIMNSEEWDDPYGDGYSAYLYGKRTLDENPYPVRAVAHDEWQQGWLDAYDDEYSDHEEEEYS